MKIPADENSIRQRRPEADCSYLTGHDLILRAEEAG